MTDLLDAYERHREQGQSHYGALKALARRFDLDKATVGRVVERAQRGEHQAPPPLPGPSMSARAPRHGGPGSGGNGSNRKKVRKLRSQLHPYRE